MGHTTSKSSVLQTPDAELGPASSRAESLQCDLKLASTLLQPQGRVAQTREGFVACGCFQDPGSGEPVRSCPAHPSTSVFHLGCSRHEASSFLMVWLLVRGFQGQGQRLVRLAVSVPDKIFLTVIKTKMKKAKENVPGPNFPCHKPDNLI